MTDRYSDYPVATLKEYGYRDYSKLKPVTRILKQVLSFVIFFGLYLSIIIIAIQSLNSSSVMSSFESISLKWYPNILQEDDLMTAIGATMIVSLIATALATILGTFFAIGLYAMSKKKRQQWMLLNNVPILNADIVTGFSLMLMFILVNTFIKTVFTSLPQAWSIFGLPTLVLAHLFFAIPFVILNVMPKLKETDPNLMDAALDLGVKPLKAIVKVLIPAIKAGVFAGMLLAFTMSIDDFVISFFNTGETFGMSFDNLSVWIYGVIGRRDLSPSVYAFSTLLTIFTLVALIGYELSKNRKGRVKIKK
ncbi:MAG: ABC transporter permease [Bacilli bacterium]|nr:ABC transporter permease [Bacilli bacterium]MBN2876249.1 ABC transporter permease [Bacilli bacterium]